MLCQVTSKGQCNSWEFSVESSLCQEWKVLNNSTGVKVFAVFLRKGGKKVGEKQKKKRFCPFTCCLHVFSCYFSLALLLPHAMQEIQDGHNGYHSEAEPDQVASFTHLSFFNCVARYYMLVLVQNIPMFCFSRKRIHRKYSMC